MFKNYFKTAWRNLFHNKTFSVINISGLALGMTCSLLIVLWVMDEYNVDAFHKNNSQLYYVYDRNFSGEKADGSYNTQGLLANELKRHIAQIKYASAIETAGDVVCEAGNKLLKRNGVYAGSDFFLMFTYPLIEGTPNQSLNNISGIVISQKMANDFFGGAHNAIGKTMRYANNEDLVVTGVFKDLPNASSIQFDFVRPWEAFINQNAWAKSWGNNDPFTVVQLQPHISSTNAEARIKNFLNQYLSFTQNSRTELGLQPYSEKYLHENFVNGIPTGGRIEYVKLFSIVAIIILLIACINFMNLSTARSIRRSKEVGVRKVLGAARSLLIIQFLSEALLLTFIATLIALLLTVLLLPAFNLLCGKQIIFPASQPVFWLCLLCLVLITSFVAGCYPALFMSSLRPVQVLKSKVKFGWMSIFFRKGLVVFQFTLSIIFIVGMIVIYQQMNYVQTKNLGFNRSNLIYVPIEGNLVEKYNLFKEKALSLPGITDVSRMLQTPTGYHHYTGDISWQGKAADNKEQIADATVGYDFAKTLQLQLKEGRDFSTNYGTDSTNFLINESMAAKLNYQNPVGKQLSWGKDKGIIIGVLKDFHFYSMHTAIDPMVIRLDEKRKYGTVLIRVEAAKTKDALAALEKLNKDINPKTPFSYQFADEAYSTLYKNEQLVSKLSDCFAIIAIFICCLGLLGLITFTAEQKTKEIGIRKVLGASVASIIQMLSKDFLKLVLLAAIIAFPIAWWAMEKWLQSFAYRITIGWWMFVSAGMLTILIALITISFQSIKAAIANPVKSLRTE
ncbi:MAG TPA: ABC transporter permease [Chitinophagaceae bacterium]